MNTSFKVHKRIEALFEKTEVLWITQIANILWMSRTIVHRAVKDLLQKGLIAKIWKGSHTRYKSLILDKSYSEFRDVWKKELFGDIPMDFKTWKILQEYFYKFSPEGRILSWFEWIKEWCISRNMNIGEKMKNFIKIKDHVEGLHNDCWLINAWENFGKHFANVYLDETFYADQYNRMEFGRWKLAEMTFFAKQSQNIWLINQANNEILLKLECTLKKGNFDAIAITPWSIDRKNQLLGLLRKQLTKLGLPFVNIIKYYENNIPIPQKSLKTREQRVQNATNTIFIQDKNVWKYKNIFLIDDFVWSWSTLNQTAKKLKDEWVEHVTWFAYVWNLSLSYDVVNEV